MPSSAMGSYSLWLRQSPTESPRAVLLRADAEGLVFSLPDQQDPLLQVELVDLDDLVLQDNDLVIRFIDDAEDTHSLFLQPRDTEYPEAVKYELKTTIETLLADNTEVIPEDGDNPDPTTRADGLDGLQLDHADFSSDEAGKGCQVCSKAMAVEYFEINGLATCSECKDLVVHAREAGTPWSRFFRALIYGLLAGSAGSGLYYAIMALTGYEIGLVAIVVGFAVGAAVHAGSNRRGGAAYQVLAVFLTYLAIVTTYMPEAARGLDHVANKMRQAGKEAGGGKGKTRALSDEKPAAKSRTPRNKTSHSAMFWVVVFAISFAWPVLSLFVSGVSGILGLVIVGFALYEAGKLTKRVPFVVHGPYAVGAGSSVEQPDPMALAPSS